MPDEVCPKAASLLQKPNRPPRFHRSGPKGSPIHFHSGRGTEREDFWSVRKSPFTNTGKTPLFLQRNGSDYTFIYKRFAILERHGQNLHKSWAIAGIFPCILLQFLHSPIKRPAAGSAPAAGLTYELYYLPLMPFSSSPPAAQPARRRKAEQAAFGDSRHQW